MSEQEKYPYLNKLPRKVYEGELHFTPHGHQVIESMVSSFREAPEPAPKHDGKLGKYHVSYWRETYPLTIDIEGEELNSVDRENLVELSPKEALSLLDWLIQEREELQRLARK